MTNDALKSELRESAIIMANLPIEFGVACITEAGAQRIAKVLTDAATALEAMDTGENPWIRIGSAVATVTMLPNFDLRNERIKILEAALQKDRAESHARQTAMLGEINKLKAIENSGSAS